MLKSITAKDYMNTAIVTFRPEMDVIEAVADLLEYRISGAPVVDENNKLVGMLSEQDCLQSVLTATYHEDLGATVGELMTKGDVDTVDVEASIVEIAERFIKQNRRRLPVLENGRLVGQISRRDVLRAFQKFSSGAKPK